MLCCSFVPVGHLQCPFSGCLKQSLLQFTLSKIPCWTLQQIPDSSASRFLSIAEWVWLGIQQRFQTEGMWFDHRPDKSCPVLVNVLVQTAWQSLSAQKAVSKKLKHAELSSRSPFLAKRGQQWSRYCRIVFFLSIKRTHWTNRPSLQMQIPVFYLLEDDCVSIIAVLSIHRIARSHCRLSIQTGAPKVLLWHLWFGGQPVPMLGQTVVLSGMVNTYHDQILIYRLEFGCHLASDTIVRILQTVYPQKVQVGEVIYCEAWL